LRLRRNLTNDKLHIGDSFAPKRLESRDEASRGARGDVQGQDFQHVYFSDLTSLGNAQCTILRKVQKPWLADFSGYMGNPRQTFQRLVIFLPNVAIVHPKQKPPNLARSGGLPTK
jgi:hypothetical protein